MILIQELDEFGNFLRPIEKYKAHEIGAYHRAFSVFIINSENHILLQQRSCKKYHSPTLWSNTCCSHPAPHEIIVDSAKNRLSFEMGLDINTLHKVACLSYNLEVPPSLFENEKNDIYIGFSNETPLINKEEVMDYCWIDQIELTYNIEKTPNQYTPWFLFLIKELIKMKIYPIKMPYKDIWH